MKSISPNQDFVLLASAEKILPTRMHVATAAVIGVVQGDWSVVKAIWSAASKTFPTGSRVIGSDGFRYKLKTGNGSNDPTTDPTNWEKESSADSVYQEWSVFKANNSHYGTTPKVGQVVKVSGQLYELIGSNWQSNPETDNGVNWKVLKATPAWVASALDLGAPLGDWKKTRDYFAALGLPIPAGARVIGSDGKIYQVSAGSDGMTDPTATGSTGYVDVSSGVNSGTPTIFNSDTKPAAASVKVGDEWNTTAATENPYSKNSTYRWDGSAWQWLYGEGFVVFDWNSPEYNTPGAYHLFKFSSASKPHGDTLNGTASADKYVIPEKGTYVITANYMGRNEWVGRIQGDIVGSRMRLVINSAQRGWNGNLMYGQIAEAGVWTGHSVSEVIKVEAGSEVVCEIEQTYSKLLPAMWRVNIKRVG